MKKTFICLSVVLSLLWLSGCTGSCLPAKPNQTDIGTGVEPNAAFMEKETTPTETESPETVPAEPVLPHLQEPQDSDFVPVQTYIPGILVELKYATEDNFTNQVIYDFQDVYLRYGTVKKLLAVQQELQIMGLGLKIWDGFRPAQAQFDLWEVCPDPTYVANPNDGFSSHSRGNTVDIVLVDDRGEELQMPTGFDDFSLLADRNYADCSQAAGDNARLLEEIMKKHGFSGYYNEWWHYSDLDSYPVEHCFDPALISLWEPDCEEYINLRTEPDSQAEAIYQIYPGECFFLLGHSGEFSLVEYQGVRGYVLTAFAKPCT